MTEASHGVVTRLEKKGPVTEEGRRSEGDEPKEEEFSNAARMRFLVV
jgi:hypothetical protein